MLPHSKVYWKQRGISINVNVGIRGCTSILVYVPDSNKCRYGPDGGIRIECLQIDEVFDDVGGGVCGEFRRCMNELNGKLYLFNI